MRLLRAGKVAVYCLALILVQGLAMVLSSQFFDGFVSYTISTTVMLGVAILVGMALGWVSHEPRALLLAPSTVTIGSSIVFLAVGMSPVWLEGSQRSVSATDELTRQAVIFVVLTLIPIYIGVFVGVFIRERVDPG